MKLVIGIISYLPDDEIARAQRIDRFEKMLEKLGELFPSVPIMVVAQNWGEYAPQHKIIKHSYDKLGILLARRTLRKLFLESDYTDMITIDDDCILIGDSGEEYKKQLKDNYGGMGVFRWEYSQLNLLYISKDIYKEVDLPDIDPEKDEGFEDTIFTATVRQLYPDKVFTFENTGIEEIGFRYEGEDKVPSTWAGTVKRDWRKLRGNTAKIKEHLDRGVPLDKALINTLSIEEEKKRVKLPNAIDIVITYVDSADKEWQKLFNKHSPKEVDEETNSVQRFRADNRFKYIFRGIEMFAPWVGDVFLVVQSKSQVPHWVNQREVKIVLHSDIIPKKHLPVFNSQAIEMYIGNIKELNNRFIYFNDDMYFVGNVSEDTFFSGDKVRVGFSYGPLKDGVYVPKWKQAILNSNELVNKKEHLENKDKKQYITPGHGVRAYFKDVVNEVNTTYKKEIDDSITRFRENNNYTVYLYDLYMRANGLVTPQTHVFKYFTSNTPVGLILNSINNPESYQVICINDTSDEADEGREELINKYFAETFPTKSKYEQ